MLRVFKPQFISNLVDSLITIEKFVFGNVNDFGLDVFLRRFSRFFPDQISKIIGREVKFVSAVSHRRQKEIYCTS